MQIAILGWGSQGQSAYDYWNKGDNHITVCDKNTSLSLPDNTERQLGDTYLANLGRFDLFIRTPALHPRDIVNANANNSQILEKVWSNTNEFMKVCPTKNIVGVTGTKGKGTTSTLIARMLEAAGKKVHLGGNIGIPPLELLKNDIQPDDWVVLELANFQLIDIKASPHIAVCLMVEPEHMDWHEDFEEYVAAKQQLFINQSQNDVAVYYAKNESSLSIASASEGTTIPYMEAPGAEVVDEQIVIDGQNVCRTNDIKLLGKHNWQNVCAAVTAFWQVVQETAPAREVLTSFTGLEHRLEFIHEHDGVKYYDDSFGTTPATAIVAIETFKEPKIVILGGSDKGATYETLAETVKANNVKHVVTIGSTGPAIAMALRAIGYEAITEGGETMESIVETAKSFAEPGDIVLLSTGCASFGLFKNYKHRGEEFQKAVRVLS